MITPERNAEWALHRARRLLHDSIVEVRAEIHENGRASKASLKWIIRHTNLLRQREEELAQLPIRLIAAAIRSTR